MAELSTFVTELEWIAPKWHAVALCAAATGREQSRSDGVAVVLQLPLFWQRSV